ncbi:MAG: 30S ribosomal protein S6 [Acidobacteriota bacterium]
MRTYELVFITDPRVSDEDVTALADEYKAILSGDGGVVVTKTEFWGRRKLAYEIQKVTDGKYVVVYFASEPGAAQISEVERRLGQNDKILRFLTIRTDEDLKRAGIPLPLEVEVESSEEDETAESGETAEA